VSECSGILEVPNKGPAFLRQKSLTFARGNRDEKVSPNLVRQLGLREGVEVTGQADPKGNVTAITEINGLAPEVWARVPEFNGLTVIQPNRRLILSDTEAVDSMRILDLFVPAGKGQRGLIVAPPKAGKTRLLQELAHAISVHHPEVELLVMLIDERPEEVTDMRRTIRGEVYASSSDSEGAQHLRLAKLVLEYARRKVEAGKDVVLLIDSLTRLGRAFNVHQRGSGRTLSGGLDSRALEIPRRIFGSARQIEHGGSLTILATALIETGSRLDELIFQEFKGTGNMELVLSRELADLRIFPAIDLNKSGTRKEELLFGDATEAHYQVRRAITRLLPTDAMPVVKKWLEQFPTNAALVDNVSKLAKIPSR